MKQRFLSLDEYINEQKINESKTLNDLDKIINSLDFKKLDKIKIEGDLFNELKRQVQKLGYGLTPDELLDLRQAIAGMNEGAEQAAVQKALKAAGFDLKQSEFKVGVKKDGALGKKIYLNGTYLGNNDNWDTMITKFTKYIQEDPKKFGLNEASITADIIPGAEVNIMDMKGIVTEITQTWNGTVYEFNFKNDLGEDHSAIYIGDKFILKEGEEISEELNEKKIDLGNLNIENLSGSQSGYVGAVIIRAIEKEIGHIPNVYEFSKLIKNVVSQGKQISTKAASILVGEYEWGLDAYNQGVGQ